MFNINTNGASALKQSLLHTAIRTILPALMGAVGALLAALAPAYHQAFCTASVWG